MPLVCQIKSLTFQNSKGFSKLPVDVQSHPIEQFYVIQGLKEIFSQISSSWNSTRGNWGGREKSKHVFFQITFRK